MNVVLIYPEFPDTFWSFKHALKFIRKQATSPPLGLLTVAALLPGEWNKRLIDTNLTRLTQTHLAWADYALISAMTVQRESTRQIIAQCKQAGVKVIAGGPLFTTEYNFSRTSNETRHNACIQRANSPTSSKPRCPCGTWLTWIATQR